MKILNKKMSMTKYLLLLAGVSLLVGCTNDKDGSGLKAENNSESQETMGSSELQPNSKNLNDIFEFYEIDYSIPKSIDEISGFYKEKSDGNVDKVESILYISDKGEYIYMNKTGMRVQNYFDKNQTIKNYDGIFSKYAPGEFGKIFEAGNDYMTATTNDRLYPFVNEEGDSSLITLVDSSNFKSLQNNQLILDNFEKFTPGKEFEQLLEQPIILIDSNDKKLPIVSYDKKIQTITPINNLNDLYMNLINFRANYAGVNGDSYKIEGVSGMSQEELNAVTFSNGKKEKLTDGVSIKYGYHNPEESIGSVYYFTNGTYIYATKVLKENNSEGIIINTDTNYAGTAIEADQEIKTKALNRLEEAYENSTFSNKAKSDDYEKYFYDEASYYHTLSSISTYGFKLLLDSFQLVQNKSGEFYNFEVDFGYKKENSGHINGEYDFINNKFHIEKIDFTESGIKRYDELSENYISEQRKQETKVKHEKELENNK